MVVVRAERLAVEDVEGLVREGLGAGVAGEAGAVIFAFELAVGGGDGGFFDREVAAAALRERRARKQKGRQWMMRRIPFQAKE